MSSPAVLRAQEPRRSSSCPQFVQKRKSYPGVGEAAKELLTNNEVEFVSQSMLPMVLGRTPEVVRDVRRLAEAVGVQVFTTYVYVPPSEETHQSLHVYRLTTTDSDFELHQVL